MAVYTQLTPLEIDHWLQAAYAVGPLHSAVGIAQGVENTNYLLQIAGGKKFILTLYEKRVNARDLPFFVGLMQHLARRGVPCPEPVMRRDGALYGMLAGKPAALVSFLAGKSRLQATVAQVAQVGTTLATLHQAAQDFPLTRANDLSLAGWQGIYKKIEGALDGIAPELEALVRHALPDSVLHMPAAKKLLQGTIHADLFPDNVFFDGTEHGQLSGLIDFYFACTDALAYDLAITMNAWCFDPQHRFDHEKAKSLMVHYQAIRPFAADETAAFPALLRGAALRFLLTRAHDWLHRQPDALVTPHDPLEYAAKLRFHRRMKTMDDYGF